MANKLRVDELRAKLADRKLSTAGTKPILLARLEEAIREEDKLTEDSKKRKRDSQSDDSTKVNPSDTFPQMDYRQLRKEANRRGLSATGTKTELLEKLCNDFNKGSDSLDDGKEDKGNVQKEEDEDSDDEKIVTATKKGVAVLDEWLPDSIKTQYHVYHSSDDIYDAMLNQTNLIDNNNKFFIIQLLENDHNKEYLVYTRWGRVGVKGQSKMDGPYDSHYLAIDMFGSKFYSKTKNYWSNRKTFVSHPKCYAWLEMDYSGKENESDESLPTEKPKTAQDAQTQETKLERRLSKFISLICNVNMMTQQMMEIGYNAKKLPLGKLSKSTISKGYEVLKRIADVIDRNNKSELLELTGEFYTVIPHDFGFKHMSSFVIDTPQKLKHKLEMVEALGEIVAATKLLSEDTEMQEDPLYSQYQRLNCELTPVEADSEDFSMIATYMQNTHAKTHSQYKVDIVQIFKASRFGEVDRFRKFSSENRMLLWHGSRLTNWAGILSQGLRIAPPEAPVSGYMFGKGVYFADMFSKSANYCCTSSSAGNGVLLLCEVALGNMAELLRSDYNADKLPAGKLSTKGVGQTAPNPTEAQKLEDGVVVPLGKPTTLPQRQGSLLYNEYIVYNVEQIRMRYVIQVKFSYCQ